MSAKKKTPAATAAAEAAVKADRGERNFSVVVEFLKQHLLDYKTLA